MSPGAVRALTDFVRLTAEEPSGLYFENFLKHGADAWPSAAARYPALRRWPGITGFKQSLTELVGVPSDCRVLLANRSAQLMKLAAGTLFRSCSRVLTTDLSWPAWQEILHREANATGGGVVSIPLRQAILFDQMTAQELVAHVVRQFNAESCDGLFLPAVDNLGVWIPVREIVQSKAIRRRLRFTVIDGAQAVGHVPIDLCHDSCDLLIAGVHKWIRAYQPLGLAFYARPQSRGLVDQTLRSMLTAHELDDPLLRFVRQMESGETHDYSETTNNSPLFSCCGALQDALPKRRSVSDRMAIRCQNAESVVDAARGSTWGPLQPDGAFRSGVVLLHRARRSVRQASAEPVRAAFRSRGLTVSAYGDGLIRLSMPDKTLNRESIDLIRRSLQSVN
jgi:hypothetical protein